MSNSSELQNQTATAGAVRILGVHHSRAFLSGLKILLSEGQYQVFCAASMTEALLETERSKPDVIICGLELPEQQSLELIKALRCKPELSTTPILVLTATTDSQILEKSIDLGADGFSSQETIRTTLLPQLRLALRLKALLTAAPDLGQLQVVQTLIGTYAHDLGNVIAILEGRFRILLRTSPSLLENPSIPILEKSLLRLHEMLKKMRDLKSSDNTGDKAQLLKAG